MKEFNTQYPVVGTSAMKVRVSETKAQAAIIAFPQAPTGDNRHTTAAHAAPMKHTVSLPAGLTHALRSGSARGKAFNRVAPWQAAAAGTVFSIAALMAIFF